MTKRRVDLKIDEEVWAKFSAKVEATGQSRSAVVEFLIRCLMDPEAIDRAESMVKMLRRLCEVKK